METSLFFILAIGIFIAVLVLFKPMAGLVLMILYISMAVFPTLFRSFLAIFSHFSIIKLLGGLTFGAVLVNNIFNKKHIGFLQSKQAKIFLFL